MLRFGITGAFGFLGWHVRARAHCEKDVQVTPIGRPAFKNPSLLANLVSQADVVVHLAGLNRGDEKEIERTNVALTDALISACEVSDHRPHIIFANSTHVGRQTAYGQSKRRCADKLRSWARGANAKFSDVVMPGLFGEKGRPFYNSVVSTFCYQLANSAEPQIVDDQELELIHAQAAAARIIEIARSGQEGEIRISGRHVKVSVLLSSLNEIAEQYKNHVFPSLDDTFDLALFNTYRSYLFPKHYPVMLTQRADARGRLFEVVKTVHGGQCFISTTHPGVTRGNHYHTTKIERFLVMQGTARIRVRDLFSPAPVEFLVNGDNPEYIDMPTFHTHEITNIGSGELWTLFWAHEIFDSDNPDTYSEQV